MTELIYNSLKNITEEAFEDCNSKFLLFVNNAAGYMIKPGKLLKNKFPNMLHVTCIAHSLHRLCEFIRDKVPDVDKLVSLCKKNFLKAPHRISIYREVCPDLPLPPSPVLTKLYQVDGGE